MAGRDSVGKQENSCLRGYESKGTKPRMLWAGHLGTLLEAGWRVSQHELKMLEKGLLRIIIFRQTVIQHRHSMKRGNSMSETQGAGLKTLIQASAMSYCFSSANWATAVKGESSE